MPRFARSATTSVRVLAVGALIGRESSQSSRAYAQVHTRDLGESKNETSRGTCS
jgi:hypothetical protein